MHTARFARPQKGPHFSLGPRGQGTPQHPLPEGDVLVLQQTFYKALSCMDSYLQKRDRPGSLLLRQQARVLNFKLLLCQDAALT